MTLDEYWVEVNRVQLKERYWRFGQTAFNVLVDNRPDLAEIIRGTNVDPFYDNDRLTQFAYVIAGKWEFDWSH